MKKGYPQRNPGPQPKQAPAQKVDPVLRALDENLALFRNGKKDAAFRAIKRMTEQYPERATIWHSMGAILFNSERMMEALPYLEKAYELDPNNAIHAASVGAYLLRTNEDEKAIDYGIKATQVNPKAAEGWDILCVAYQKLGRIDEAIEAGVKASECAPHVDPIVLNTYAAIRRKDFGSGMKWLEHFINQDPKRTAIFRPYTMDVNYFSEMTEEAIFDTAKKFGMVLHRAVNIKHKFGASLDPKRQIRVGFISSDMRRHSVSQFLPAAIEGLKKHKDIDVRLYHVNGYPDEITERYKAYGHFQQLNGMTPVQVSQFIFNELCDILIDTNGLTSGAASEVLALQSARIQAQYLGYPNTVGLPRVQYRIVDDVTDTPEADNWHTETLIRMNRPFLCFTPIDPLPDVKTETEGNIIFGSFNNFLKFSNRTIELWGAVLEAIPEARLRIKSLDLDDPVSFERVLVRFPEKVRGQIEILPQRKTPTEHLETYSMVDVALDTTPYNGTTTTFEALAMGVPVIALEGRAHRSRVTSMIVSAMGQPDWVARTTEEYVEIAKKMAANVESIRKGREALRQQLYSSPLGDKEGFGEAFYKAVRQIWTDFCEKETARLAAGKPEVGDEPETAPAQS